jgi:hypothetical protein
VLILSRVERGESESGVVNGKTRSDYKVITDIKASLSDAFFFKRTWQETAHPRPAHTMQGFKESDPRDGREKRGCPHLPGQPLTQRPRRGRYQQLISRFSLGLSQRIRLE